MTRAAEIAVLVSRLDHALHQVKTKKLKESALADLARLREMATAEQDNPRQASAQGDGAGE